MQMAPTLCISAPRSSITDPAANFGARPGWRRPAQRRRHLSWRRPWGARFDNSFQSRPDASLVPENGHFRWKIPDLHRSLFLDLLPSYPMSTLNTYVLQLVCRRHLYAPLSFYIHSSMIIYECGRMVLERACSCLFPREWVAVVEWGKLNPCLINALQGVINVVHVQILHARFISKTDLDLIRKLMI